MPDTERAERVRVDIFPKNPFGLTFHAKDHDRSLVVEEPNGFGAGTTMETQDLLRTLILAHLTARHFPKVFETNFPVENQEFLARLYKHYGYQRPKIVKSSDQVKPRFVESDGEQKHKALYVNAHSGGLDSVYRAMWLLDRGKSVLISHLRNLNTKGNSKEALASRAQAEKLNLPYVEIKLRNGTDNTRYNVMRTRDMFLGLIAAMVAEPYGVKKVLIEGDMQEDPGAPFTDYAPAWVFFNNLMKEVGLSSQVEGKDAHDIETIAEVLKLEKKLGIEILPMVQNCFTGGHQIRNCRKKWERETPLIAANSSCNWCGSCEKCRRMTLGRLVYEDPRFGRVSSDEMRYFVADTRAWLDRFAFNREIVSENFLKHLDSLEQIVK